MPHIYHYTEADGFEGDLILDERDGASAWLDGHPGGTIVYDKKKTARYNAHLIRLLTSREQMAIFKDQ